MFCRVSLIGRLGQDPEVQYSAQGTAYLRMGIAVTKYFNDSQGQRQEKTNWHNVVVFGKNAENCGKYLHKGALAHFEGELENKEWNDKQTGEKKYATDINCNLVNFLQTDKSKQNGNGNGQQNQNQNQNTQQNQNSQHGGQQGNNSYAGQESYAGQPNGNYDYPEDNVPF